MFDLSKSTLTPDSPVNRMPTGAAYNPDNGEDDALNELDKPEKIERHGLLLSYYRQELDRQGENRRQQAIDAGYYDGDHWTEDEKQVLRERGQVPIAYNVIKTTADWVIGSEKRGRTDFKILPRGKEDTKPAESKTRYMKYLSDVNRKAFHRSAAFTDAVKVGVGWLETGAQDPDDAEQIYTRREAWRNILWDSAFGEIDGKDMRYLFRSRWIDEDIAKVLFPDRADAICNSVTATNMRGSYDMLDGDEAMDLAENQREESTMQGPMVAHRRRRVRLIEAWYRMPQATATISGGMFDGQQYDGENKGHVHAVSLGGARINRKIAMRTRVAVLTTTSLLYDGESPYKHNRFPFTPVWGYRRDDNGLPYGMIRQLRDIQDDINKRASKALAILSNNKTVMDEDALPDGWTVDDFAAEVAKPNAIIMKRTGKMLELSVDRELAPAHLDLMTRNIAMVQQVGGVTDEQMGRTTNATSGRAIEARQSQGSMSTAGLFDNLRMATQMDGEIELSLIEQYVTEQKEFRITGMRGAPEFHTINDGLPENDITRTKADFVISEADWRASIRQAQSEQFGELLTRMPPEVALTILDLFVDGMDIENRDEMVKRIRAMNGQRDPDQTEPTQQEIAAQQAQAAQQQQQQAAMQADLALKQAQAAKTGAEADRTKALTMESKMNAALLAMTAATQVIQMPTIAKVGDGLLTQVGWDGTPVPTNLAAQGVRPPMQAQQQPPQFDVPQPQPQQGAMQP